MAAPLKAHEVSQHRWWGWGNDDVAFRWDNKPDFADLAHEKVGLDLRSAPEPTIPKLSDYTVPVSILPASRRAEFVEILGEESVVDNDEKRVLHSFGRSLPDLFRARNGHFERLVDVVLYPGSEEEIAQVLNTVLEHDLVLVPYGGGSCISGSLTPDTAEQRPIVSMNLGRLRRVLDIDQESGLARVEAGAYGPDLEDQLNSRGWTVGHFPDSFTYSTLGGWAATRSSGMQSDKYGDIEDIVRSLRMVGPTGTVATRPIPGRDSGPSVHEMVLGSEGRLGVITECTVRVHPLPQVRDVVGYFYPSWPQGSKAMHEIERSEAHPTFVRLSDGPETRFSLAMVSEPTSLKGKVSNKVQDGLFAMLKRKGWETTEGMCISYVCFEGSEKQVKQDKATVAEIVKSNGGISVGTGPGKIYDSKKFDTPYLRDFLLNYQVFGDVCDTGVTWSNLNNMHSRVHDTFKQKLKEFNTEGFMFCHMSHSYHQGACLYFTFAIPYSSEETALEEYYRFKNAVQQEMVESGGTLSHHHAVGTEHQEWIAEDNSEAGVELIQGLFNATDPGQNLNPGKIVG